MPSARVLLMTAFLLAALVIAVWDICVIAQGRPNDTISVLFNEWAHRHPILPLMLGILIGHVIWPVTVPVAVIPEP